MFYFFYFEILFSFFVLIKFLIFNVKDIVEYILKVDPNENPGNNISGNSKGPSKNGPGQMETGLVKDLHQAETIVQFIQMKQVNKGVKGYLVNVLVNGVKTILSKLKQKKI